MAKLALIKEGMNFATKQIAAGISAFAPVLTEELHVFRTFLLTHEVEEEEDADDEESLNGDGDGDENDNIIELLGGNASDLAVGSATGNAILQALSTLSVPVLDPVFPEVLAPGVSCWKFPKEISQGFYKGRNGSNACSLISILLGYALSFQKVPPPECQSCIASAIVEVLCGCIEIGNRVYNFCRESLPSRYLSIQEAASVLEMWCTMDVGDNLPVRLKDHHVMSTVSGQLKEAISSCNAFTAFLILNDKTSLFYFTDSIVMYIDTHCHGPSGAVVLTAEEKELDSFCTNVWELESNDETTYGNLVFVDF